jgi:hypothetical protein
MTRRSWVVFLVALFTLPVFLAAGASADKAGIPIDRNVEFDETAQNAIAAWNGQTECLILSTDLQSAQPGRLMEMLPLPSAPYDIQPANVSAFKTVIGLYNEKMRRLDISPDTGREKMAAPASSGGDAVEEFVGIDVVFSSSVGLHNITVVKLENNDHFIQWTQSFAASQGVADFAIDERLNLSVADHLNRSISYFVFDIVNVTGEKRSAEPLAYFFNTTFLYYPLKVTYDALPNTYWERNRISVFLIADGVVRNEGSYVPGVYFTGGVHEYIEFSTSELRRVFGPMGALFSRNAFMAHLSGYMHGHSYSTGDVKDVVLNAPDLHRPTDDELRAQYERADYLRAIKPLSPSLAYYVLRSAYEPDYAPPAPYLALIVMGIFIAPVTLAFMYRSVIERRQGPTPFWIIWLTLYCTGTILTVIMSSLVMQYSSVGPGLLFLYPALVAPLLLAVYFGSRFKTRPAAGKHAVPLISTGLALAQVMTFVFIPSSIVAVPIDIVCFPVLGIAGLVLVPLAVILRRRAPAAPAWSPGPQPSWSPPQPK